MLDRELVEAVKLAREAGRILLELYALRESQPRDFGVDMKGEADPVTEADRRVNAFLTARLREAFPTDTIIAEESANEGRRASGRCWLVDPLDGTKEFIARNGEFSVMIGLAIDGDAQLGVVYQPTTGKLWRGVVGDGAFVEQDDKTFVLRPSDVSDPSKMKLVVSRSHRSAETDAIVQRLGITQEAASGSVGLKVGLIAERKADLYVHLSDRSSAWDACAPDAILRAAGGTFTDLSGRSIEYGTSELRNKRGILACNRKGFEKVLPIVSEIARGAGLIE
ncbi:MAG: 3'(2'),5'-bisphosphate nucleotidase CysQ [Myxococcota bacterium]|nr:3'(2'),5'-bisphosphate nucleotidase CysQ [Myxococcota bacterium]